MTGPRPDIILFQKCTKKSIQLHQNKDINGWKAWSRRDWAEEIAFQRSVVSPKENCNQLLRSEAPKRVGFPQTHYISKMDHIKKMREQKKMMMTRWHNLCRQRQDTVMSSTQRRGLPQTPRKMSMARCKMPILLLSCVKAPTYWWKIDPKTNWITKASIAALVKHCRRFANHSIVKTPRGNRRRSRRGNQE